MNQLNCIECGQQYTGSMFSQHCPACDFLYQVAGKTISDLRAKAKANGLEFNLSRGWLVSRYRLPCPFTGVPYEFTRRNPKKPSVSRFDTSKGYTEENCQVVSLWYNMARNAWDHDTVVLMAQNLLKNDL